MLGPVVYVFLWMTIFGGSGLRMEREAAESELCCHNVNMSRMSELVDILGDGKINLSPYIILCEMLILKISIFGLRHRVRS